MLRNWWGGGDRKHAHDWGVLQCVTKVAMRLKLNIFLRERGRVKVSVSRLRSV
jgi:hypothetical protein